MKPIKVMVLMLGLLLSSAVAVQIQAQAFNKKTVVTFNQPVAVPGKVLAAGKYTFTIADSFVDRNIVQIWNADQTELITTILAIANYRLEPVEDTVIQFSERPAGRPQAVKAWFYPGHAHGIEFVYPKEEAVQIAQAAKEVVPAEAAAPTPSTLETVPLFAVTPQGEQESLAKAFQMKPAEEKKEVAQALPKTASLLPLIALFGVSSILLAFGLRRFAFKAR